jgi:hypothetical protein
MVVQDTTMVKGQESVDLYAVLDVSKTATAKEVRNNTFYIDTRDVWIEMTTSVGLCLCVDIG